METKTPRQKPGRLTGTFPFDGAFWGAGSRVSLELRLVFHEPCEGFQEILKCRRRHHDRIPPTTDIFGDLEETSTLVLFEVEEENLFLRCIICGAVSTLTDLFSDYQVMEMKCLWKRKQSLVERC